MSFGHTLIFNCSALGEVESMIKFQQEFDTKTLIYDTTSTIIAYLATTVTLGSLLKVFSRESDSRIANVRLSIIKTPWPPRIMPIYHNADK